MKPITSIFSFLPSILRDELLSSFNEIQRNFRESRWEPAELNGGKLCEVVYTIIRGHFDTSFPAKSEKPRNMVDSCRALEQAPATFARSMRIQIPRMILSLYEIRNNRNVGHTGGEVNPNEMDATAVLYMSKWIMAELVRIFHNIRIRSVNPSFLPAPPERYYKYRKGGYLCRNQLFLAIPPSRCGDTVNFIARAA